MKWPSVLWRVMLAGLLLNLWMAVWELRQAAPAWVQAQITREADATRTVALTAIADTRKDLLKEVADTRKDLLKQVASLQTDTNKQVAGLTDKVLGPEGSLKTDLLARVDKLTDAVVGSKDSVRTDLLARVDKLDPILKDVKNVTGVASDNADLLGRCEDQDPVTGEWFGNQDCFANRLIPAMKNFEHMAAAGEKVFKAVEAEAAPTAKAVREGAQQVTGIATDIHTATTDAVAPVPWYKKVGNAAYSALILLSHFL